VNPFDVDVLRDLLARADYPAIAALCAGSHPATAAEVLEGFSPEQVRDILRHLEDELRADVFTHFSLDFQVDLITLLKRREVARLMTDMPPDDRADLFKSLSELLTKHAAARRRNGVVGSRGRKTPSTPNPRRIMPAADRRTRPMAFYSPPRVATYPRAAGSPVAEDVPAQVAR